MVFSHQGWTTEHVLACVGLRQGCSALLLQDTFEPLHESWSRRGFGLAMDAETITHLVWADDTWVVSHDTRSLYTVLTDLSQTAEKETGLEIWWDIYNLAIRGEQKDQETVIEPADTPMLAKVSRGERLTWLRATTQIGTAVDRKCWIAFSLRRRFRGVRGRARDKMRMLHTCIFLVFTWCSGSRHWTQNEFKSVYSMH